MNLLISLPRSRAIAFLTLVSLLFSCSILPTSTIAQSLPPKVTTFSPSEYKAHSQIFCVEELPDGRKVFGTGRQILVYDGEDWRHVIIGSGRFITAIEKGPSGQIFIGGTSTMGVVTPDSTGSLVFRSITPLLPDSLRQFRDIWQIHSYDNGWTYFNTSDRDLFAYDGDTIHHFHTKKKFYKMFDLSSYPVVQEVGQGLLKLKGEKGSIVPGSKEFIKGKPIKGLLPSARKDGNWTVFTHKQGLYEFNPKTGKSHELPLPNDDSPGRDEPEGGWENSGIYTVCRLDPGKNPYGAAYVVGSNTNGILLLSRGGKILLHLGEDEGIPAQYIWSVHQTKNGDILAGTNNGIALVHTGRPYKMAFEGRDFQGSIQDVGRHPSIGAPLFLATSQGTWYWKPEKERFSRIPGTNGQCMDLTAWPKTLRDQDFQYSEPSSDKQQRMLVGGTDKGFLSVSIPQNGQEPPQVEKLIDKYVYSVDRIPMGKEGDEKPAWQTTGAIGGGKDGIFIFSPQALNGTGPKEPRISIEKLPEEIFSVGAERTGTNPDSLRLWSAMRSQGVIEITTDLELKDYRVTHHDTSSNLPPGIVSIMEDPDHEGVVFGTDSGLYEFKDGTFVPDCRFGTEHCKKGKEGIYWMAEGPNGEAWINDWTPPHIIQFIPTDTGYKQVKRVHQVLDIGTQFIFPEKNRTWLGGDRGLACYYPHVKRNIDREWHCLVRKVLGSGDSLLFGGTFRQATWERARKRKNKKKSPNAYHPVKKQPESMTPVLDYSHNRMEFSFAAPFNDQQKEVEYRYQLGGFDTAWSKWTKETKKEYTNLPEGAYTFKVKARNVYGKESKTATYRFIVLPPWYRTWAAYSGYSIAGVGFIWLLLWLNGRRLVAQKERLEETVRQRTKEIENQKERIEEEQKRTEKQKKEVERAHQELAQSHREITDSINYAQRIQEALLHTERSLAEAAPSHFIFFKPQQVVSGDFYWAYQKEGYLYFAAVDCTGHGVPGAFMSMLGVSFLNDIMAGDEILSPGQVLTKLRDRVVRELNTGNEKQGPRDGMDAAMVRIPLGDRTPSDTMQESVGSSASQNDITIEFAGANNPLYIIRDGIVDHPTQTRCIASIRKEENPPKPFKNSQSGIEIKPDKMAVGYEPGALEEFITTEIKIPQDSMIYMFSDGFADQFGGPKGKKFRYGPFKKLLDSIHKKPEEDQKRILDEEFEKWRGDQEQVDDVCVVGIRV